VENKNNKKPAAQSLMNMDGKLSTFFLGFSDLCCYAEGCWKLSDKD
jgi:hypothetical protein